MKKLWVFPAINILLWIILLEKGFNTFVLFLVIIWALRILMLRHLPIIYLSIVLTLLLIGNLWLRSNYISPPNDLDKEQFTVIVRPATYTIDGDLLKFKGKPSHNKHECIFYYQINSEEEKIQLEDQPPPQGLKVLGEWGEPNSQGNFYQFDYKNYLANQGIYHYFYIREFKSGSKTVKTPLTYHLDWLRYDCSSYISYILPGKVGQYTNTLLLGINQNFTPEILTSLRNLGIIHVLSISGLHIQLIIQICYELLLRLRFTRKQIASILLIILPTYGLLTGLSVSVFRAISQAIFSFVDYLFKQPTNRMDNWSKSFLLISLIKPCLVFQMGFQLSYLFSFCLILYGQSLVHNSKQNNVVKVLNQSFFIFLISLFPSSFYFYEINLFSLFINLLFIPIFSVVIIPSSLFMLLTGIFFHHFSFFKLLVTWSNNLLVLFEESILFFNRINYFRLTTGRLPLWSYLLLAGGIILFLKLLEDRKNFSLKIIALIICIALGLNANQFNFYSQVIFLDVGQGDAILIQEPFSKKVTLIDTGGQLEFGHKAPWQKRTKPYNLGKDTLIPALKAFGVREVDQVIISHADTDHMGALSELIQEIPVHSLIVSPYTFNDPKFSSIVSAFENTIPLVKINAPKTIGSFHFIHPQRDFNNSNENSLVVYAKIGGRNFLFTGDIGIDAERELIQLYPNLQVDILKVGHHGSKTSTSPSLLTAYQPQLAVISVGENNLYHHPHPEVLACLKEHGVVVGRTDQHGAIRYQYYNSLVYSWFGSNELITWVKEERMIE